MMSICDMLSRSARDVPMKEAIACRGLRTPYAALDAAATRIAAALRRLGVTPGQRVAVLSVKCPEEVAILFGLARAGAVLVHINPAFREDGIRRVLADCDPVAIFVHPAKLALLRRATNTDGSPRRLIHMGPTPDERAAEPTLAAMLNAMTDAPGAPALPPLTPDDLAAIIYTSGTTGTAKGIMVTHGILSDATRISASVLDNRAEDRLISLTPFSFDGALSQLFTAVLVGGTLVLQDSHFPKDVVATLQSERITGFHAMPSFWRMLLARYPAIAEHRFPALRYLSLIGEVFPEPDLLRLKAILDDTDVFMMYGTTEAFRSTYLPPSEFHRKRGTVGKALPGVTITIEDEHGAPCPPGVVGEIVHGGAFVSPGYWGRAAGKTFRNGKVHTGDLGRLDDEGYLTFVGRADTMVKRLGFQVYPEDIEASLQSLDGIALAAVVCTGDGGSGADLRAFVVPSPGATVSLESIRRHCRRHLPHYMVPDDIVFRDTLPTTGTSKIDRARLRLVVSP